MAVLYEIYSNKRKSRVSAHNSLSAARKNLKSLVSKLPKTTNKYYYISKATTIGYKSGGKSKIEKY